jgi:demethylmenaquinone methyltransferase/2-methoxy-6-polyprenyl-1,4-benzoquinol methylase
MGTLYRFYFRRLLPMVGGLISGDRGAYAYLPASVERFATPDELAALLAGAGFVDVVSRRLTGGIAWLHRGRKAAA